MMKKLLSYLSSYVFIMLVVLLVFFVVKYPKESLDAAYGGLTLWFSVVLPALLPFFIGSELLIGLGVVKFVGIILEPIMGPVFNVPGEGSFAYAMSITSGYPVGAKIVTRLRQENSITSIEAQRLAALCSTSGPLFMMGAVGVGMFKSAEIGIFIAICHYLGSLALGFLFRFYKITSHNYRRRHERKNLSEAFKQLGNTNGVSKTPIGILMGNAVKDSINTMLMVGGFIVLFSVIIKICTITGFIGSLSQILVNAFHPIENGIQMVTALLTGILEITLGCKMISEVSMYNLSHQIMAASFVIAWSGFSIHFQAISILSTTDISVPIYFLSKLFHGVFSAFFAFILFPLFYSRNFFTNPTFLPRGTGNIEAGFFSGFILSMEYFIMIILFLLIISLFLAVVRLFFELILRKKR